MPITPFSSSKTLSAFVASDDGRPLIFEQLPFDHPLYILYSSGTTGAPKCIVHSAGVGQCHTTKLVIISHTFLGRAYSNEEGTCGTCRSWHVRHIFPIYNGMCLRPHPQITSHREYQTAWMMWPYMLSGLACGARMILYEGSPFFPDVKTYLKLIDEQKYGPIPT